MTDGITLVDRARRLAVTVEDLDALDLNGVHGVGRRGLADPTAVQNIAQGADRLVRVAVEHDAFRR